MKVIAVQEGFIGGVRRRAGKEFEIDESMLERDVIGEPVLPRWLHSAEDAAGAQKRIQYHKSRPVAAVAAASAKRRSST